MKKKMSDTKLRNSCSGDCARYVKYGEMNALHVHKCRVTELIIAIRILLLFREKKKTKQSQAKRGRGGGVLSR